MLSLICILVSLVIIIARLIIGDTFPFMLRYAVVLLQLVNLICIIKTGKVKATPHRAGGADAQSDFSSDCMKMTPLG